jgi:hypothetical protein
MDNYRVTSWQRFGIFKSSEQDFSKFCYSSGVSDGSKDGDPDDCFSPSKDAPCLLDQTDLEQRSRCEL